MRGLIPIQNSSEIVDLPHWQESIKFYSRGRVVDSNGNPLTSSYKGKIYRLISKKEYYKSTSIKILHKFLALILLIGTFGLIRKCKSFKNINSHKYVKRYAIELQPSSRPIRPVENDDSFSRKELAKGIQINNQILKKINSSISCLINKIPISGCTVYDSEPSHMVFSLDLAPNFIFKIQNPLYDHFRPLKERYENMVKAKTAIRTECLDLLVLPSAKLIQIKHAIWGNIDIIVEKKLNILSDELQDKLYDKAQDTLNETVRQLAVLILKTGLADIHKKNIPLLDELDSFGHRKIGLIDVEVMVESREDGLGGYMSPGLIRCVNEPQGQYLQKFAKRHRIPLSRINTALQERCLQLRNGVNYPFDLGVYHLSP
ncbi:MAG: hypothetical protein MRY21_07445 [Simkaniaceae bacterium]|nr:hypothetical protein [Simkaniaceae bacterium]